MTAQPKSAYLNLFDNESKHDDYRFKVENKQAWIKFADAKGVRPMIFEADEVQFAKKGGLQMYKLRDRFDDVEADVSAVQVSSTANTAAVASEQARAQQEESKIQANVDAANTARGQLQSALETADTALTASVTAEAAARVAADAAEASARASAISSESTARASAVASLQSQISNILSNADPAALDSLAEVV